MIEGDEEGYNEEAVSELVVLVRNGGGSLEGLSVSIILTLPRLLNSVAA